MNECIHHHLHTLLSIRCLTANKEFVPSEQWGWTASSHLPYSHTKGVVMRLGPSRLWPSTLTSGPACTPLLAGQSLYWQLPIRHIRLFLSWNGWRGNVVRGVFRLLKACGSRLTEKLLEGAPTEDTLVLIEKQTGSHADLPHTNRTNCAIQPVTTHGSGDKSFIRGFKRVCPTAKGGPLDAEWHQVSALMCLGYVTRLP